MQPHSHRRASWLAFVLVVLAGGLAVAKSDPDTDAARLRYMRGVDLYNQGNYAEAVQEFLAAKLRKPLPDFDYNIARCYDRLDDYDKAIEHYETFLASNPTNPGDAPERVTKLKELKAQMEAARRTSAAAPVRPDAAHDPQAPATPPPAMTPTAPATPDAAAPPVTIAPATPSPATTTPPPFAPTATPPPSPVPSPAPKRSLALPVALGVLALAAAGAGAGLLVSVKSDYDSFSSTCGLAKACNPDDLAGAKTRQYVGFGLVGLGGALAIVDAVLWATSGRRAEAPAKAAGGAAPGPRRTSWVAPLVGSVSGVAVRSTF